MCSPHVEPVPPFGFYGLDRAITSHICMTLMCSSLRLGVTLSLVKPRDYPVEGTGGKKETGKGVRMCVCVKKEQQMEKKKIGQRGLKV